MNEGKFGITLGGELELLDRLVIFFAVDVSLADQEMHFGRVLASFQKVAKSTLLEIGPGGFASRNSQYVQIVQLIRCLRPERFEHGRGVGVALGEEIAEPQKVARLVGIGHIAHDGFEGRDGGAEIVLTVVDQAQIETNARYLRH